MQAELLAEAGALVASRRAFALATVVWRRAPASGQVGSKAIVLPDGSLHGWIGGACSEPTLVREALGSLTDGRSRLLFLGPADELSRHEREGVRTIPMACESEGALEVHIEPFLPTQQLVIIGRSPAVRALTVQARALDWDVVVIDDGGVASDHPYPELVRTSLDLSGLGIGRTTAVVIATQGHYDDVALECALTTEAAYIGVVAAEKRASALRSLLRERGFDEHQLARVHAPVGLDLGPVENAEIAVAVLADLVARRAAGQFGAVDPVPERREARDPVCGMVVYVDEARYERVHDGVHYWFCSGSCQRQFDADPAAYVER